MQNKYTEYNTRVFYYVEKRRKREELELEKDFAASLNGEKGPVRDVIQNSQPDEIGSIPESLKSIDKSLFFITNLLVEKKADDDTYVKILKEELNFINSNLDFILLLVTCYPQCSNCVETVKSRFKGIEEQLSYIQSDLVSSLESNTKLPHPLPDIFVVTKHGVDSIIRSFESMECTLERFDYPNSIED
jgi:hypothetical protein